MAETESSNPAGWEDLLDALRSVVAPRGGAYVAGPLNTGPRLYEEAPLEARAIRAANDLDMRAFVAQLRETVRRPVIDTSQLRPLGWSDRQIGEFFLAVLSELAGEAWFIDGWEFSRGATKEFEHCIRLGIPCFGGNGEALPSSSGMQLITEAIVRVEAHGEDASRLRARLQALTASAQLIAR